jgi:hypothetical protein
MALLRIPDKTLLEEWLADAEMDCYLCGQCDGLHIRALQGGSGVIDSRLFVEEYGLLLTTELEIRPGSLLLVSADLGRLNMDYPTLKLFLDVADEVVPQLAVAGNFLTGAGLSQDQFSHFMATSIEATEHLAETCRQLSYLYTADESGRSLLH